MAEAQINLQRQVFETSRLLEFFNEKELLMQIGHPKHAWPIALTKELLDNALDACEAANVLPEIEVVVEANTISVQDNGPGLPAKTIRRSLDYLVRVSDKSFYASPTRGQLGNALKCVWAAPFVANGQHGVVEVMTGGVTYRVDVTLNYLVQEPVLKLSEEPGFVKNGTLVKIHWSAVAGYLSSQVSDFYNNPYPSITDLVLNYACFNPHLTIRLRDRFGDVSIERTQSDWIKSKPGDLTSPHWYNADRLKALIGAYIKSDSENDRGRTVREFVSEFSGLSATAKQKTVSELAGLSGAHLTNLLESGQINTKLVSSLLVAMQSESRPVKPLALGIIGENHLRSHMITRGVHPKSIRYKRAVGTVVGVPFVWELALGIHNDTNHVNIITGLNWTPTLKNPIRELIELLGEQRVDSHDPLFVAVHLACPVMAFSDRGKSVLNFITGEPSEESMGAALAKSVRSITREWAKAKRQADRENRVRQQDIERMMQPLRHMSIKDAAYEGMEAGYMAVSDHNKLPAKTRQMMYAVRPYVLKKTGGRCWKNSSYFTQVLLPNYMKENPETTRDWDVVFDARGHLIEPHTRTRVELGTLEVRKYIAGWTNGALPEVANPSVSGEITTVGPQNRFKFALFVEKEGFEPLFERVNLADRYDVMIMSTKGMSVTAARHLVEHLSMRGVTILVARDFDKSGFSIFKTLGSDTRRYKFKVKPKLIDLGLRLADVKNLNLQSEFVSYSSDVDPSENLKANGATDEECEFLVHYNWDREMWEGQRVELNAMASRQLIDWIEAKFEAVGVEKIMPGKKTLAEAYQRAIRLARIQEAIDKAVKGLADQSRIVAPRDLEKRLKASLQKQAERSWDQVLWDIVRSDQKTKG
jgi:DNA topoisomerase VI subunit B